MQGVDSWIFVQSNTRIHAPTKPEHTLRAVGHVVQHMKQRPNQTVPSRLDDLDVCDGLVVEEHSLRDFPRRLLNIGENSDALILFR